MENGWALPVCVLGKGGCWEGTQGPGQGSRDWESLPGTCGEGMLMAGGGAAAESLTRVKREINIFNPLRVIEGTIGVFF